MSEKRVNRTDEIEHRAWVNRLTEVFANRAEQRKLDELVRNGVLIQCKQAALPFIAGEN